MEDVVSIGIGGALTVRFSRPVTDDPENLHGIDLIVYGNPGFIDLAPPGGLCGGLFGGDGGTVEVSSDGTTWVAIPEAQADGGWPTLAWLDAGPYDTEAGTIPSDPTLAMPVDVAPADMEGYDWDDLLAIYGSAAGGTGIDLAPTGLQAISFVRLAVPADAFLAVEIDAVVDAGVWMPGDLDGDGLVGVDDLLAVIAAWGSHGGAADVDGDGYVGVNDLLAVLESWT